MYLVIENKAEIDRAIEEALEHYQHEVVKACAVAVKETSEAVLEESKKNTPVETGELLDSAVEEEVEVTAKSASENIGYTAPYAGFVHENLTAKKPKFLERAVMSVGPSLRENVVKELR